MVIREGKNQGVRSMLVTHATNEYRLSIDQLKEAAELGAYLEFVWSGAHGPAKPIGSRRFVRRDPNTA